RVHPWCSYLRVASTQSLPRKTGTGVIGPGREGCVMDFQFAATAFATAFTIIDPIGMIPLTLASTGNLAADARSKIVNQAVLVAAGIMLFMGVVGRPLLGSLGITLPAFTIAGGILLFLIAIDMLFARKTGVKRTDEEEREAAEVENPAVFPLAVPMISGPGTIATVLLLVSLTHGDRLRIAIVFSAYLAALLVTWLCMRAATLLLRIFGNTGIHVVTRLLGIILAALAVQFVLNGLMDTPLLKR
ncbi:MAG: MarC family protein, partial [Candidatus Eremiobacteraeota bacterium]|nr:MarC family protein [Candidatus Eremiobacteraeota bacterium]